MHPTSDQLPDAGHNHATRSLPQYSRVGVTGSRNGLTRVQERKLMEALEELHSERGATHLHHGDCKGADEFAARAARSLGYIVVGHPPKRTELRAFFPSDEERDPDEFLARDRTLVGEVDLLFGCPDSELPRSHSGTWYTLNYARDVGTKAVVIVPDGWWGPMDAVTNGRD